MILSAVSVLVVAQSSSEIPEGLMNNPVYAWGENKFKTVKPIYSHCSQMCSAHQDNLQTLVHSSEELIN